MNGATKTKGYAVGSHVALNADSIWAEPDNVNVIHEVMDARLSCTYGIYVYRIAPIAPIGVDASRALEVDASDVHPVR